MTIIDRDPQTSALYNVSTSVLDPTIPEDPGRIRAMLELSGWSLRPTFDGQGNTVSVNVTFVVQIDIRGTLPSSVVKSMTSSMTMAVSRLNQFINKTGYPPFASHISGTRLLDTFEPQTGFFELCYKAAPGWTEVRVGRKVYKEGYDFFIKPDDPTVRVELAPDFGGVRIWTTLDHEGQSIIAQVSRKGQYRIEPEYKEEKVEEKVEEAIKETKKVVEGVQVVVPVVKKVQEDDAELASPISRKNRNASSSTLATSSVSSARPDSQASIASRASQGSEKGGRRGRSRTIVALPAGTPPPPLPRRSSSLSRYSIPISPYVPEDVPPLPTNTTITAGILASAGIERTSSLATSPTTSTPANVISSSRPVSDALASPTLGPFHIPHRPAAVPRISSETRVDAPAAHMESINTVLAEPLPASPSSVSELELEPTAVVETKESVAVAVAVAAAVSDTTPVALVVDTTAVVKDDAKEDANSSAAPSPIPSSPIKELVVATLANIASPAASPLPTQGAVFANMQSSRLKHSASSVSVGGTRRVTFSLETIEISSSPDENNKDKTSVLSASPLDEIVKLKGVLKDTSATAASTPNAANIHTVKIVEVRTTTESQSSEIFSGDAHFGVVEEAPQSQDYESDEAEFVEARDELSEEEEEAVALSDVFVKAESSEEALSVDMVLNGIIRAIEEFAGQLTATQIKFGVVFLLLIYYAGRLSPLIAYA